MVLGVAGTDLPRLSSESARPDIGPSFHLLAYGFALSLLTGILFGLTPALRFTRLDLHSAMKTDGASQFGRSRLRGALLAVQAAVSLLLLLFSGGSLSELRQTSAADMGFDARNTYLVMFDCCLGVLLAHAMFDLPWVQSSVHIRTGPAQWLAEGVATFGLLLVVLGHRRTEDAAWMVAAWIGAAYWFTASTSFANPAITIARSLSDTFAGIRPTDVPAFIAAQLVGAGVALLIARPLFGARRVHSGATQEVSSGIPPAEVSS